MTWPRCLAILAVATACGDTQLPPLGEALVIVDTDAAVPLLISRLRVDAYTTDGVWYSSDDFGLPAPLNWPASFGIYSPDPDLGKTVILRLRGYADGNVRDYRGERYMARPSGGSPGQDAPLPSSPRGDSPRLIASGGVDVTPPTEPAPLLTIDRLLLVEVTPGHVESLPVTLKGSCFGTMADLASRKTCIATENELSPLAAVSLVPDLVVPGTSQQGGFGVAACAATPRTAGMTSDGVPLYDEEVCVPGGAFVFGSNTEPAAGAGTAEPERIAVIPPFRMGRYEVTVARYRQAVTLGFVPPPNMPPQLPLTNDGPFPTNPTPDAIFTPVFCSYSSKPLGRETVPLTCINWDVAKAFCEFEGGDLPTESQWEYAAEMAGRPLKTAFPWGGPDDGQPTCSQAVFGRGFDATNDPADIGECTPAGFGPLPEDAAVYPRGHVPAGVIGTGDVSVGLGLANLGGSVKEWVRDTAYSLGSNCWMSQPLTQPWCDDPDGLTRALRGAGWDEPQQYTFAGFRFYNLRHEVAATEGFRCVRTGTP
jgi:formylglycine-generating enzyme required for sulfatase activity